MIFTGTKKVYIYIYDTVRDTQSAAPSGVDIEGISALLRRSRSGVTVVVASVWCILQYYIVCR